MKFRAKHAFNVSQPKWTGQYKRLYGEQNEGFVFEADNLKQAQTVLREEYNLNPFYVLLKPEVTTKP